MKKTLKTSATAIRLKEGYRNPTGFRRWVKVAENGFGDAWIFCVQCRKCFRKDVEKKIKDKREMTGNAKSI